MGSDRVCLNLGGDLAVKFMVVVCAFAGNWRTARLLSWSDEGLGASGAACVAQWAGAPPARPCLHVLGLCLACLYMMDT